MKRIILIWVATMWCLCGALQAQQTRTMQVFKDGQVVYSLDVAQMDSVKFVLSGETGGDDDVPQIEEYVENGGDWSLNLTMVKVEGGTFEMGATAEQGSDASSDEQPTHMVTLSAYHMSKYEITQAQWKAVMGTTIEQQRDKRDEDEFELDPPSKLYGVGDNYPMYHVSWKEAKAFCEKLSQKTGKTYVLPTEAQWEFAARGGKNSKAYKYSGSNTLGDVAWYDDNSDGNTHEVGTKTKNELGIYDMSGNVKEWCADVFGEYSSDDVTDPAGLSAGSDRVIRGGGRSSYDSSCRVSFRESDYSDLRTGSLGFRVVCLP